MRWVNEVERRKGSGLVNVMEVVVVGLGMNGLAVVEQERVVP